jgi:hypothetical protein
MGRREGNPSNKSANEHKNSLSQVTKWLSWFWDLERIWSLELCLGVNAITLVLNEDLRKLGCFEWRWLGVFIASNHFLAVGWHCCRWAHRTTTFHCLVRTTSARSLGFGAVVRWNPLSFCYTGQSGATLDMSGDLWLLCSDFCAALFIIVPFAFDHWCAVSHCSAGSPDMFGAHRTVRWIIAESVQRIPESGMFVGCLAWSVLRQILIVSPTGFLSSFVSNLMHLR